MKTGLVVSAHPGDFVWRAGGAIALHAKRGYRVKIVCLAFGERGESQFAWKEPGMTLEKVKAGRKDEDGGSSDQVSSHGVLPGSPYTGWPPRSVSSVIERGAGAANRLVFAA